MHGGGDSQLCDNEIFPSRLKPVNQLHNVGMWVLVDLLKDAALPPDLSPILSDFLDHLDGTLLACSLAVASVDCAILPPTQR